MLKKILTLDDTNPEVYYFLGEALCKQEHFSESVKMLQKADTLLPNHPRILHLLGWATFLNGDPASGRKLLLLSLKKLPTEISTLCDLAVLENEDGNGEKAKELAQRALSIDPTNSMAQEVFQVVSFVNNLRDEQKKPTN